MFKETRTFLITILTMLSLSFSSVTFAQEAAGAGGGGDVFNDSMQDLIIVAGVGAGGAVLGLSTLSFVEEPSEHLNRLWVGASIGIILGVGIVAFKHATKSQRLYEDYSSEDHASNFDTKKRLDWHQASFNAHNFLDKKAARNFPIVAHSFTF